MPVLSIIVPICNVEQYLVQCLDSLLNQSFRDFEVICIDDGSTDGSPAILDAYAQRDARVRVVHKKNSGYGHSMNIGLSMATGEFVGIVESDDFVAPDMYEVLIEAINRLQVPYVRCLWFDYWDDGNMHPSSSCLCGEQTEEHKASPSHARKSFMNMPLSGPASTNAPGWKKTTFDSLKRPEHPIRTLPSSSKCWPNAAKWASSGARCCITGKATRTPP